MLESSYVLNHSSMENETELFKTKIIVCSSDTCLHYNRKPIRLRSTELDMKKLIVLLTIQLLVICFACYSQSPINITINASKDLGKINPNMYGVFFEDINLGADGGIYAELIKNRSFEFFKPLMGWTISRKQPNEGDILVLNRAEEMPENPRFIRIKLGNLAKGELGITNEGFRGMGIKSGLQYNFSVLGRVIEGSGLLHLELLDLKIQTFVYMMLETRLITFLTCSRALILYFLRDC